MTEKSSRGRGETNTLEVALGSLLRFLTLMPQGKNAGTAPIQPLREQLLPEFGHKRLQDHVEKKLSATLPAAKR